MIAKSERAEVKLPRWEAVHRQLSLEYVDAGFLDDVPEKISEGYVIVEFDNVEPPYLVVLNRGAVYETGRVDKSHENQNIGSAYTAVEPSEVRGALRRGDGELNAYELPGEVASNVCKVINSETRYGDLKTEIVDVNEVFERLEEDGFSGSIVFTNTSNYSYVELRDGEVVNCWHRGDAGCSTVDDLRAERFEEGLEVNVFGKEEIESSGRSILKEEGKDEDANGGADGGVEYGAIADALADAAADVVGRSGFHEALSRSLSDVEGAAVRDREDGSRKVIVSDDAPQWRVFEAISEAVDESTTVVPASTVYDEARDEIRGVRGGEDFLRLHDVGKDEGRGGA